MKNKQSLLNQSIGILRILRRTNDSFIMRLEDENSTTFQIDDTLTWVELEKISEYCVKNDISWRIEPKSENSLYLHLWNEEV